MANDLWVSYFDYDHAKLTVSNLGKFQYETGMSLTKVKSYSVVSMPDRLAVVYSRIDSNCLYVAFHLRDSSSIAPVILPVSQAFSLHDF